MRLFVYLGLMFLVFVVTGCATTRSPSEVSRLQIKVAQLERQIEENQREITDLKDELDVAGRETGTEPSFNYKTIEEPSFETEEAAVSSNENEYAEKNKTIIRVEASAEKIQQALKNAGYYDGKIDGKLGKRSQEAIAKFQADHSLKNDGVVGKKTWSELQKYLP